MDLSVFSDKQERKQAGIWKEMSVDGHRLGEVRISVLGGMAFSEAFANEVERWKRDHRKPRNYELDQIENAKVAIVVLAKHVLVDWRPLQEEDAPEFPVFNGEVLPCTLANRLRFLEIDDFRNVVQDLGVEVREMTVDDLEDDRKN